MKKFVFVFTLFLKTLILFSQEKEALYREQIAIHLNASVLLAGERLLMTVYCLDASSNQPSSLSSIVYVELIGANMKPVVQAKVRLQNGAGGGDFLLPNQVNSGNYTLIAYTRWMRNFSEKDFFQRELAVINPLRLDPTQIISETRREQKIPSSQPERAPLLQAKLNKEQYGLREQVTLSVINTDSLTGRFSISIRALEDDVFFNEPTEFGTTKNQERSTGGKKQFQFLPDLRGELVTGRVLEKSTNLPLKESLVSLSAPAKDFQFLISRTDSSGRFYFNVPAIESDRLLLALPGKDENDFTFKIDNPFLENYSSFTPSKFGLENKHLQIIEKKFVHQQVNDAFASVKKDSISIKAAGLHFYGIPEKQYVLDRFTRFPTMEDVFRELIPEVVVKKRGENFSLEMFSYRYDFRFEGAPLVLIDGIMIEDANVVMAYDPMLIKQISVRNKRYFYGDMLCNGLVSIETFSGEAKGLKIESIQAVEYIPPVQPKAPHSPAYSQKTDLSRVPDYRNQLFWTSDVIMQGTDAKTFTFFTSDVSGKFIVDIKGVNSNGEIISVSKTFQVLDNKGN